MSTHSSDADDRESRFLALDAALREASGLGVVFSQVVADYLGISPKDLECLDILYLRGPVTAGELAQATGLTTGAITGLIDRLEAAGFARRERAAQDRRKVLVRALPSVDSEIMPLYASLQARMHALMAQMPDDDLDRLLAFLTSAREIMVSEIAAFRSSLAQTKKESNR